MTITLRFKGKLDKLGRDSIRFDVSHTLPSGKKERKLINTGIKVNPKNVDKRNWRVKASHPEQKTLNKALENAKEKMFTAINRFETNQSTFLQVIDLLDGKSNSSSIDDYIETVIKNSRSTATYTDYKNTLKAFKKNLNIPSEQKVSFIEFSSYEILDEFKRNCLKNGLSGNSVNSYLIKVRAVLNDAYKKNYIYEKFELDKSLKAPKTSTPKIDTITPEIFIEGINKAKSIYDLQALGLYLLMFGLRGMYQADIVALKDAEKKHNDFDKKSPYHSIFNDGHKYIIHKRHKTRNTSNDALIIRVDDMIPRLIKVLKYLFKKTHPDKIISNDDMVLFEYDLDDIKYHKNLWDTYQKRLPKLISASFKTARKTYNTYATELEYSDTIKAILLGHSPTTLADKHYTNKRTLKISEKVQNAHSEILEEFDFGWCSRQLYIKMANYLPKNELKIVIDEAKQILQKKVDSNKDNFELDELKDDHFEKKYTDSIVNDIVKEYSIAIDKSIEILKNK